MSNLYTVKFPDGKAMGFADYTVTQTNTAVKVSVTRAGIIAAGVANLSYPSARVVIWCHEDPSYAETKAFPASTDSWHSEGYVSHTWTIPRGHTASSEKLALLAEPSGEGTGAYAETYVSVPALDSWKVSYDANGGQGAPSPQTKWRGETLKLTAAVPTRQDHHVLGWAKSPSGTVAYRPGGTYKTNAALKLYAVWKHDYIPPTLTAVTCTRCVSAIDPTPSDEGAYALCSVGYTVDTTATDGNGATKAAFSFRQVGSSTWGGAVEVSLSGTSGTASAVVGPVDVSKSYEVSATVYDAGGSASRTSVLPVAFFTLDVGRKGHSVGIGTPASDTADRLDVGLDCLFGGKVETPLFLASDSAGTAPPSASEKARLYGMRCLYSNSSGSTSSLTLQESCEGYAFVDVYYKGWALGDAFEVARLYNPNGGKMRLTSTSTGSDSSAVYTYSGWMAFNAKSVTRGTTAISWVGSDGTCGFGTDAAAGFKVYYIFGWKG